MKGIRSLLSVLGVTVLTGALLTAAACGGGTETVVVEKEVVQEVEVVKEVEVVVEVEKEVTVEKVVVKEVEVAAESLTWGFVGGFTGWLGPFAPQAKDIAALAIAEINRVGPPLNAPISMFVEDTRSDAEQGVRAYARAKAKGADAIIGPSSNIMSAIIESCQEDKIPCGSQYAGTDFLDNNDGFFFRSNPSDSLQGPGIAQIMWDYGFRTLGALVVNDEGSITEWRGVRSKFEDLGGVVQAEILVSPGQASYSAEVANAFAGSPDVAWIGATIQDATTLAREWFRRGYGGQLFLSPELSDPEIGTIIGEEVIDGAMSGMATGDPNSPAFIHLLEVYAAAHGDEPYSFLVPAWDQAMLLALGYEAAGSKDGDAVMAGIVSISRAPGEECYFYADCVSLLRAGQEINYQGASGPVDLTDTGNVGLAYMARTEIVDGTWWTDESVLISY